MQIPLTDEQYRALLRTLAHSEDAEQLSETEYLLDTFDTDPPLSMQLELQDGGVDMLALCELGYDEALAGYYIARRIEDESSMRAALERMLL